MKIRKTPTESEAGERLERGQLQLPPLRFELNKLKPRYGNDFPWDFEVEAHWENQSAVFAVEHKSLSTPKAFADALGQCLTVSLPKNRHPLILMPYLSDSQLAQLEQHKISGLDWCGNGVVIVPKKICVYRTGNPNQFASYAPIKNIYRKNTSMVARVLLAVPQFSGVGEMLAELNRRNLLVQSSGETPMSLATVSKALQQLDADLIIDRSKGIRLLQPDKLLDRLEQNYERLKPENRTLLKVDCPFHQLPAQLARKMKGARVSYVAAGLSSVTRYATMQREEVISLYCFNLKSAVAAIGGRENDRFHNVELIESREQPRYFDAQEQDGFYWASPTQTYLELMRGDKRDRETAIQVRDSILRGSAS